ncbi:MAG: hypothetical protein QOD67_2498 [Caballeronia sp.]|nr:hypothetical protein [Caballeronia sp.]
MFQALHTAARASLPPYCFFQGRRSNPRYFQFIQAAHALQCAVNQAANQPVTHRRPLREHTKAARL